jgi:hypothetical protein
VHAGSHVDCTASNSVTGQGGADLPRMRRLLQLGPLGSPVSVSHRVTPQAGAEEAASQAARRWSSLLAGVAELETSAATPRGRAPSAGRGTLPLCSDEEAVPPRGAIRSAPRAMEAAPSAPSAGPCPWGALPSSAMPAIGSQPPPTAAPSCATHPGAPTRTAPMSSARARRPGKWSWLAGLPGFTHTGRRAAVTSELVPPPPSVFALTSVSSSLRLARLASAMLREEASFGSTSIRNARGRCASRRTRGGRSAPRATPCPGPAAASGGPSRLGG